MDNEISNIQKQLKTGKGVTLLTNKEINYMQTPIGKALYKNALGRPTKIESEKAHYSDRIQCDICPVIYTRSHRAAHRKTKVHQAYASMNQKMAKLLLNEN